MGKVKKVLTKDIRYWSKDLESGHETIDNQHKRLVFQYQQLEDAIQEDHGLDKIAGIALFLHRYVLEHFNTEEQEMLAHDYPEYPEQAEQHDEYKKRIFKFKEHISKYPENPNNIQLAKSILFHWYKDHPGKSRFLVECF